MVWATRSTVWLRCENGPRVMTSAGHPSGIERRVRWAAGYDCRVKCPHDRPGNHGQSGDELALDVRSRDAAVSLVLFTWARDGLENQTGSGQPVKPGWLHLHYGFVFDESDVRTGAPPAACDVLEAGQCWSSEADCSPSVAREIWERSHGERNLIVGSTLEIEKQVASPEIETIVLHGVPKLWTALEAHLKAQRERRWTEHQALPRQCDKCRGTGLLGGSV